MRCVSFLFFSSLTIVRKASPVLCNPVYSIRSMLNDKQMVRTHRHKWKKTTLRWFNLEIKIKKRKTSSSWAWIDSVLDNCTSPLRKWHLVVNDAVHNRWQFGMLTVPQWEWITNACRPYRRRLSLSLCLFFAYTWLYRNVRFVCGISCFLFAVVAHRNYNFQIR